MRLSVVAIVKDEEDCIRRMLKSVAPIADELIVVDTGSTDTTPQLAAAEGARVYSYTWDGSFGNARNFALSIAQCPWRLVLDADEWLVEGAELLTRAVTYPPAFVGQLNIRSTFNDPSSPEDLLSSIDRVSRLLPSGVQYRGDIHEQPHHSLPVIHLAVTVNHDGYQLEKIEKKGDRNLLMLERTLQLRNDDSYLRFQYARELKRCRRLADASANIQMALQLLDTNIPCWREDAVCLALEIYAETNQFQKGLSLLEKEAGAFESSVDLWFTAGIFFLRLAENSPSLATAALERMESSFSCCLELGKRGYRSRMVVGRESWLAERNLTAFHSAQRRGNQRLKTETGP